MLNKDKDKFIKQNYIKPSEREKQNKLKRTYPKLIQMFKTGCFSPIT